MANISRLQRLMYDVALMIPASFQAIMSYSLEEQYNIKIFGYDFFLFLFVGFIPLLDRTRSAKNTNKETTVFVLFILSFLFSLRFINDYYFAHAAIGVEFLLGYIFAKNISYKQITIKVIYYLTIVLFLLIAIQQISFSLGLGWLSTGQREIELVDGIYRVGTSAGGSTFTGIFLTLLVGILLILTSNTILQYSFLLIGSLSIITTGTRSAIIVMVLMSIFVVFHSSKKSPIIYKILGVLLFLVYLLPTLNRIVDARNEEAGEDITSGRKERWEMTFKYMEQNNYIYFIGAGGGTVPISNYNENVKILASPHNAYIGIFFEYGFIGIVSLVVFLYGKIKRMKGHFMTNGFVTFIGSLLVCWNSEVTTLSFLYSFFFWLLYFVELSTYNTAKKYNT